MIAELRARGIIAQSCGEQGRGMLARAASPPDCPLGACSASRKLMRFGLRHRSLFSFPIRNGAEPAEVDLRMWRDAGSWKTSRLTRRAMRHFRHKQTSCADVCGLVPDGDQSKAEGACRFARITLPILPSGTNARLASKRVMTRRYGTKGPVTPKFFESARARHCTLQRLPGARRIAGPIFWHRCPASARRHVPIPSLKFSRAVSAARRFS